MKGGGGVGVFFVGTLIHRFAQCGAMYASKKFRRPRSGPARRHEIEHPRGAARREAPHTAVTATL